jgi:lysyl-tRNA synthetase class 1
MQPAKVRHWSEVISQEIVKTKKEPFVVASGITTSGPTHIGTACEFLYPSALAKYLHDSGYKTEFIFIGDIIDAFDGIPKSLEGFKFLEEHLGKPLSDTPDPFGCCKSYGNHFLNEAMGLMEQLDVHPKILRTNELCRSGRYDEYARIFLKESLKVKTIAREIADMSGVKELPEWVNIVMPICENCGKIATTQTKEFDGDKIVYSDTKDVGYVKGCGYEGEMKLSDHNYKIYWRLDWPSRQDFLKVSVELAGSDHHSRGGSWDTAVAIHKRIFNKDPPAGGRFGFVMLHGKKYSKSKGVGLSIQEILQLVPPELVKYVLFKPDLAENKEFDASGYKLIALYDEYNRTADLTETGRGELSRAESKTVLAYKLTTDTRKWRAEFTDVLINYQVYRNWDLVAQKIGDPEGVNYLKKYIENWINSEFLPEEFVFKFSPTKIDTLQEELATFAKSLDSKMSTKDVHNLIYEVARGQGIEPTLFFKAVYKSLITKDYGPRLGKLIGALGIDNVKKTLLEFYA